MVVSLTCAGKSTHNLPMLTTFTLQLWAAIAHASNTWDQLLIMWQTHLVWLHHRYVWLILSLYCPNLRDHYTKVKFAGSSKPQPGYELVQHQTMVYSWSLSHPVNLKYVWADKKCWPTFTQFQVHRTMSQKNRSMPSCRIVWIIWV